MTGARVIEETPAANGGASHLVHAEWMAGYPVVAGITTRPGAPSFGLTGAANGLEPLDAYAGLARDLGMVGASIVIQVHGSRVVRVPSPACPAVACFGRADGLVTDGRRSLLAVTAADCVPIYVLDPERPAIGMLHAGWRGTAAGILAAGVAAFETHFGSRPSDLLLHLGPAISGARYEVGPEVLREFGVESDSPAGLDLRDELVRQARECGVDPGRISRSSLCTASRDQLLHSHRASGGKAGRMAAFLGLV